MAVERRLEIHRLKCLVWAKEYLKADFSKVLWTDEMWVDQIDGPVAGSLMDTAPLQVRHQHGGGGIVLWAAIIKDELFGPFQVEDGLQSTPKPTASFWKMLSSISGTGRKKSVAFKKAMRLHIIHSSTSLLGLPSSPNLDPTENLWALFKCEIYCGGGINLFE